MSAWARIAWRELVGGARDFGVYLACLAVGAFAVAAAGAVSESFARGLDREARQLLGGDAAFTAAQRRASPQERAFLEARARVSESIGLRVMGQAGDGPEARRKQVDVRGVDDAFPLVGSVTLAGAVALDDALAPADGRWGVAASASLLESFDLEVGDTLRLGAVQARITARLDGEPDRLGTPGTFGPRALIHRDALVEAGRLTSGQLFRATYLLDLPDGVDGDALADEAAQAMGPGGLRHQGPEDAVDGLQNVFALLEAFLAVIGVAALVAGGVGVAQATSAFLESRTGAIAALKALGADSGHIRAAYLTQLAAMALLGAGVGVGLGGATPFLINAFAGARIPVPQALGLYPGPMLQALALTLLAAAAFALPALGRARATPPAALFRTTVAGARGVRTPPLETALAVLAGATLTLTAALASPRPLMTLTLIAGAGAAYGVLIAAAAGLRWGARRLAGRARGMGRLALANLGGPGSLAPTVGPALGLGLGLLTLVAAVHANLLRQLSETAPQNAPSLVFTQIPDADTERFDALLRDEGVAVDTPEAYRRAPLILARVTALKGRPLVDEEVAESERWVVDGEIGLTYLDAQPPEAVLTEGAWWPNAYAGPLLVSVEDEAARGLGLSIGDTIGFRVFGRPITAEVASLRRVDWGGFGVNTAFILSPGALEAANPRHFAIAKAPAEREAPVITALGEAFPDVVVFQTREALATAAKLLGDIALAVTIAASVVTLAGLLVLAGALAVIARQRRVESALLKTFGATRAGVLGLYAVEFALVGLAAAALGVALGTVAAYPAVVIVFDAVWTTPWAAIAGVAAAAGAVSALGGAWVGRAQLARPPAATLRQA